MQVDQNWTTSAADLDVTAVKPSWRELWRTITVLFKLRIVALLLLSAFAGGMLGVRATGQNGVFAWLLLAVTGLLSAAGASAINQYLERNRDTKMKRTAKRPLATGAITNPKLIFRIASGMVFGASLIALPFNLALSFWLFAGAAVYVGVYTIWLKPRTSLNIVIGGFAGSCAVISGGAAFGAWADPAVWILAGLIFVWTPVHFWALALAYRQDYATAAYPMLPAIVSPRQSAFWIAIHAVLTVACGLSLGIWPQIDWIYLLPIIGMSLVLTRYTILLWQEPTEKKPAMALFHSSNLYLTVVLVMVLLSGIWN